ncbi:MAG: hypothetical protein KA807_18940 [Prolixibacteraceae bacterium]|nr:hypothetical protein [Prolixibacteraceae bacterium]
MNSAIQKFMDILADNDYTAKYKEIPQEVDNRDEIIAEIQAIMDDDGLLPDSLRFFELNGKTTASELKPHLHKAFQKYRNEFLAGNYSGNDSFKHELIKQLDDTLREVEKAMSESKQLKDETLLEMLEAKAVICEEVKTFVLNQQNTVEQKLPKKKQQEKRSFKWLKDEELIINFYNHLKSNDLISKNTDVKDFRAVFSNIPISEIKKPVQWEKGAKLFAYFFYNLINRKFIPQKPSWVNLQYCFTYNRNDIGQYVAVDKGVRAHVTVINNEGAPKGAELIDALFNIERK